jgi:hypothetical protein
LGSSASRLLMPETAGVGSVGVVWQALDRSKKNEADGLRYVTIHYGARKDDFNPEHKISKDAMAWAQTEINRVGEMFVEMVARNRGLEADAVRETEAGLLFGGAAVEAGFADAIIDAPGAGETLATKAAAMLAAHIEEQNQSGGYGLGMAAAQADNPQTGESDMSNEVTPAAQANQAQAQPEGQATAPDGAALADAKAQGAQAAQERIKAIMGCDEAKGREKLAKHFAFETETSAEAAQAALAAAGTEQAEAKKDSFSAFMDKQGDVDVGPGAPDSQAADSGLMRAVMARRLGIQPGQQKGGA